MFGDNVLDSNKKWIRYQEAFDDQLKKLSNDYNHFKDEKKTLTDQIKDISISTNNTRSIESLLKKTHFNVELLPNDENTRYHMLFDFLKIAKRHVSIIGEEYPDEALSFSAIQKDIKSNNKDILRDKKQLEKKQELLKKV